MSMILRTVKSIRSHPILPVKSIFALAKSPIRSSSLVCTGSIRQYGQHPNADSTTGCEKQNTPNLDTREGQDRPQVMVDRVGLESDETSGGKIIQNGSTQVEDKGLNSQRGEGEDDLIWGEEAEEMDEIEYNDQVITYIHRLPLELDSITFRDFFWSRGIYVVEAWKAPGKRSGIIQTSILDQELVCDKMDGTEAPWGRLIAKPGDTASMMIQLSEVDERAFEKASSQDSNSSCTANKINSHSEAESLNDSTDSTSEVSKEFPDDQPDGPKQKLYLQKIPNMNTLQIDIDPKAEVTLSGVAVVDALTSRGYKVPAYQIMDKRILIDVGNLSAEGLREILAKSHPTIKANVLEVVAFSWRSSFFSESALYEVNSKTSLLITSLSPTISGKLVLRYLQELAPKLKLSSIKWIEKRVCETWAIVTVSGQQAFESVLNVHQQPIGGVPVDVRAMPIETSGSIKGLTKSSWNTFRVHNFPFNLTDDQVRNLFFSGGNGLAVEFIERSHPRAATFKLLNPSPEARKDLASMQMSVIHGRAIHIEIVPFQNLEKLDHNTSGLTATPTFKFSKRLDGPDAGPRLLERFRSNSSRDPAPVMGIDELTRTMKVFSPSCYTILKKAREIEHIGQELKNLQSGFVRARKAKGFQDEPSPQIIPDFHKRISESLMDLEARRLLRHDVYTSQKKKAYQQWVSQQIARNDSKHTVAKALREIMYHPTHGIHALRPFDFNNPPKPPYQYSLSKLFQRIAMQDPSVSVSINLLNPNPLSQIDQNPELQKTQHRVQKIGNFSPLSNSERMLLRGRMRAFSPFFFNIFETYRKRSELSIYLKNLQEAYSKLEHKKGEDSEIVPKFHNRLWSILGNLGALVALRMEVCQRIQKQKLGIASVDILRTAQIQAAKSYYEGLKEVIYHPTHGLDARFSLNYRHRVNPPYQNELARQFQRDMTLVKIGGRTEPESEAKVPMVKDNPKGYTQTEKLPAMISS